MSRQRKPFLVWSASVLGLVGVMAGARAEAPASLLRLSLEDALAMANTRAVETLVSRERVQQALARLTEARSPLWPQISAGSSFSRQTKNLEATGLTFPGQNPLIGPFNAVDLRLKITQALFDAGAIQRLRAARAGAALSLAASEGARQDAMALVAALFLEARQAAQALEAAEAQLEWQAAARALARSRQTLGVASTVEEEGAIAAYAQSRHRWQAAIVEAAERRLDFAAALGLPTTQPILFLLEDELMDEALPSEPEMLAAITTHPSIQAARAQVREAQAQRAATAADGLPRVIASADSGASGGARDTVKGTYTVGAIVSLPLFEGGRRRASTREAASVVREREARLRDTESHVEAKARSALEGIRQARWLLEAANASLIAAAHELSVTQSRRAEGTSSDLEVLRATADAARARDAREEALASYRLACVTLAHAMGHVEATPGLASSR